MREFYQHRQDIPANIHYIEDVYQVALDQFNKHPTAKILFYIVFHERNFGKYGRFYDPEQTYKVSNSYERDSVSYRERKSIISLGLSKRYPHV